MTIVWAKEKKQWLLDAPKKQTGLEFYKHFGSRPASFNMHMHARCQPTASLKLQVPHGLCSWDVPQSFRELHHLRTASADAGAKPKNSRSFILAGDGGSLVCEAMSHMSGALEGAGARNLETFCCSAQIFSCWTFALVVSEEGASGAQALQFEL